MRDCEFERVDGVLTCTICKKPYKGKAANPLRNCAGEGGFVPFSRGLGDTVAKGIHAATFGLVKPCGGCEQRRAWLNKVFPYRRDEPSMLEQINAAADYCRTLEYHGGYSGRGVVIGAGGEKFFRCAWVAFSMLRWHGCNLPVQFWHLGRGEMDSQMQAAAEGAGIEVIDGRKIWDALDPAERPPILNGWELKPFSVLHSPFREVLYLDADCVPLANPEYLFDEPAYHEHGAIFWPDLPPNGRKEWMPPVVWKNCGMEYRDEPDFESGQFVIDKQACWSELNLTVWMNGRSDYFYKFVYGDKSTYHLAWRKLGRDYAMPTKPAGWRHPAILQHDLAGKRLFEHCAQGKESLAAGARIKTLTYPNECVDAAKVLRDLWPGAIWSREGETEEERNTAPEATWDYRYNRIGFGERSMELLPDGRIGDGAAACEKRWTHRLLEGVSTLVIVGEAHKGSEVGMMFLRRGDDGVWRGDWEYHERGPVELHPPPLFQPPRHWACREGTWDRDIWDSVVRENEYRLPERFEPSDVILDVGAHIGSFTYACLTRGAGVVHAVEAEGENYAALAGNLKPWGRRAVCYHAAAWRCDEPIHKATLSLPAGHPNMGGWSLVGQGDARETLAIPFDQFVMGVGKRIRLCKLDCEGAEWGILATSLTLHLIDELCGEWHGDPGMEGIRRLLESSGFVVEAIQTGEGIGLFWARHS